MPKKRGVVAVDTDGSIKGYFESRAEAERYTHTDHRTMGDALKDKNHTCKGFKWWYEDVYKSLWMIHGQSYFAWTISETHKRLGSGYKKGHKLGSLRYKWSEESKKRHSEKAKETCLNSWANGRFKEYAKRLRKPVKCVTDGMEFESLKSCASFYNIPANFISSAIKRHGTTYNKRFEFI